MELAHTLAVVTGGVSGLGLGVAQHLVAHGGKVALFDINDEKAGNAIAELGSDNAIYLRTDVSDEAQVAHNMVQAQTFLGGLNVAINCAGVLGPGRRSEEHTSELQSLMRNSYAVFCLKKKNKKT